MIDKDYILERITEEQIISIMSKFGAEPYGKISNNNIYFRTICHCGDSHKLCYFRDTKIFHCYTNCGEMSLFNLVMKVKNCSFGEAVLFVAREIGINQRYGFNQVTTVSQEIQSINKYLHLRKHNKNKISHLPKIDDKILNYFEDDVFYKGWIDEGISIETMKLFGIRWYELQNHIIIPHYNINSELVGIRRRSLQEKDKDNKYMPEIIEGITYGHQLGLNLYGLNMHLKGIVRTKKVIIVESEKSVMLAHDYYGNNAFVVATCGFNVSNWQRDVLLSLGVQEVYLAYDRDFDLLSFEDCDENNPEYQKAQRYAKRVNSLAQKFIPYVNTYILYDYEGITPLKSSPFDCGKEIFEKIMSKKIEVNTNSFLNEL